MTVQARSRSQCGTMPLLTATSNWAPLCISDSMLSFNSVKKHVYISLSFPDLIRVSFLSYLKRFFTFLQVFSWLFFHIVIIFHRNDVTP